MPRPHPLPTCAPDADWHENDAEESTEGSEDGDDY
jgi:hypothetical protein